MATNDRRGLVLVMTGHGKGKTTAVVGLALRAAGNGLSVAFFQFLKGTWNYGELEVLAGVPRIDVERMRAGYSWEPNRLEEDRALAAAAWKKARAAVLSRDHDLVILDDVNYVVHYRLLALQELLDLIRRKPSRVHLALTGRSAAPEVIEAADEVTEMADLKHHFRAGILAQPGIEF
ncbi:MAG: cob(I)yrinic acid a,c-diamide adenosyltransferase [Planctomycetes bacterium]|nr:cob(I)yrinic acid a,c-diamide adenosyltransferase [Planctomycetota bacterium]